VKDFSLEAYRELCRALCESGYAGLGHADFLTRPAAERPARLVLLRHDVERRPRHAVRLARVERELGLVATYFFRGTGLSFHPPSIQAVAALGHEVGYHYDAVSRARGDLVRAEALFREDLGRLRDHAPVRVASMHGSPLLPWDNRTLWERALPADFGLTGEAYRDIDYGDVAYFSDTGRTWHPSRFNIRDFTGSPPVRELDTTAELIALVREGRVPRLCLLAHPERWPATLPGWALQGMLDLASNLAKVGLAGLYGRGRPGAHVGP